MSQLRDPDQAADAAQETGLRVLNSIARFDGRSTLKTWTFGIALNVCREIRRRELRRGGMSGFDPNDEPATDARSAFLGHDADGADEGPGAVERLDDAAALREVLATLPQRQREAVTLRFFEELSVQETARAMDCAEGTVKATLFAALRNLKARMARRK